LFTLRLDRALLLRGNLVLGGLREYFFGLAHLFLKSVKILEATIDRGQGSAAVLPGGPCSPPLLAQNLLGTSHGVGDIIGQEGIATQTALVIGKATIGRLAPVLVVDLEDAVVVGSIGIGWTNHARAEGTLVLGNAGPLVQLIPGNPQIGHLPGQGASIHRSGLSGDCCQSHYKNHKEGFHFTHNKMQLFTDCSIFSLEIFIPKKSSLVVAVESTL